MGQVVEGDAPAVALVKVHVLARPGRVFGDVEVLLPPRRKAIRELLGERLSEGRGIFF